MSEIRQIGMEDIENPVKYIPNIPDNWYVPAKQAWQFFAWGIKTLQYKNFFKSNEEVNNYMNAFETWIENRAIAYEEERR